MSLRILVVEDDHRIAGELLRGLRGAGHTVSVRAAGQEGLALALAESFDLVLLDLMLPGRDGLSVLQELQHRSSVPVIVLTARQDIEARVRSFGLGAVDWMSKPFFMEELLARIQTRLRLTDETDNTVVWADVVLDVSRRVAWVCGRDVQLTSAEFNVLNYLASRPGRVVSRSQLAAAALPGGQDCLPETVNSHVARIRKKLGPVGSAPVKTVRGAGYCFE